MVNKGGKAKTSNRLWLARKRQGLGQKQVAHLLDKTIDEISRYERGIRIPGLEIVLGLEIVYGLPARMLFKDLYEQLYAKILAKVQSQETFKSIYTEAFTQQQMPDQYCSYKEILNLASIPPSERAKLRDHITDLAKRLAEL